MASDYLHPPAPVVGIVIAGGRSVRFGGEKGVALLHGVPLLMWAVKRLQGSCMAVAVNARRGTEAEALALAEGLPVLNDVAGDAPGPLSGIKVGLIWAEEQGAEALAVSPCDVPYVPNDLFTRLIRATGNGPAMAETSEGHQPLFAVWPVSALYTVTEALKDGRHPATWMLLQQLGCQRVRFDPPETFTNVNTRVDLAMLANWEEVERARRR
ncbi:MAG: molybdenum cofactor guanylyltransferase [Gammaproteobacteria bacterium]